MKETDKHHNYCDQDFDQARELQPTAILGQDSRNAHAASLTRRL
jgi:hypothetical protein